LRALHRKLEACEAGRESVCAAEIEIPHARANYRLRFREIEGAAP
jgi:hypothetical protein